MHKGLALLLAVLISVTGGLPARAQGTAEVALFALDTSDFPNLSAALEVYDASGAFVTGLTTGQLSLVEDEHVISPTSLQEIQPGVQFAVALDPGPFFAFRDAYAHSRLDQVTEVLMNWAGAHDDNYGDDLTLVSTGGTASSHLVSAAAFSEALSAYTPDLMTLTPSLDTLSLALDAVSGTVGQTAMKRSVLYITSPMDVASIPALQNLTQRALSLDIRVHVWIVASSDYFSTSGATALKDLAILTRGTYALFSGNETLPDPEAYLVPLRHGYALTYASAIRSSGTHTLYVQVILGGGTISSEPISFELNVEAPNPILVTPPEQIIRQGADTLVTDFSAFEPSEQEIEAIIEFPDGLVRPLARTALYVDGILADENTAEPFDHFVWDLVGYEKSGDHILQVQVEDGLGLEKTSLGSVVTVTVIQPEQSILAFLSRNSLWVVLGVVGAAGLTVAITLLLGQRRTRSVSRHKPAAKNKPDPLTAQVEPPAKKRSLRLPWSRSVAAKPPDAYLLRLKEGGGPVTIPPIPVLTPEMSLGSDPLRVTRLLDDPSVSPLHARLKEDHGRFILIDEKSVAGTWVNYEQVITPRLLQHGDILHFGRVAFRFILRKPPEIPAPRLIPREK